MFFSFFLDKINPQKSVVKKIRVNLWFEKTEKFLARITLFRRFYSYCSDTDIDFKFTLKHKSYRKKINKSPDGAGGFSQLGPVVIQYFPRKRGWCYVHILRPVTAKNLTSMMFFLELFLILDGE